MPPNAEATPPRLNVTSLSEFVRLGNCERFLRRRRRHDEGRAFSADGTSPSSPSRPS